MSAVIRHLNIAINGKPIVDDVDLDIADGERVGLVGSSGSGKSMIARAMMGLLPATAQVTNWVVRRLSARRTQRSPTCADGTWAWCSRIRPPR